MRMAFVVPNYTELCDLFRISGTSRSRRLMHHRSRAGRRVATQVLGVVDECNEEYVLYIAFSHRVLSMSNAGAVAKLAKSAGLLILGNVASNYVHCVRIVR